MLTLKNIFLRFGGPPLLDHVGFAIERGERVCVLGRNGEGKSTLLRIIAGTQAVDDGELIAAPGTRIAEMPQDIPKTLPGTVREVIVSGAGAVGRAVTDYFNLLEHAPDDVHRLGELQAVIEGGGGWALQARVDSLLDRLGLDGEATFDALSGGLKRRALLGRALASEPDLLLLDEPTNHLDLESIAWLEDFLVKSWTGALLFITHDRAFLQALATRIVELDRGQLSSWPGDYENYLRRREERLESEAKTAHEFDRKMANEEVWIRKGVKARRVRDMGRVKRLMEMRAQYAERRKLAGSAQFGVQEAIASGKLVAEAKEVSLTLGGRRVLNKLSTVVMRGDKVGIVGPNGAGKTTLLRLLLGQIAPESGTVKTGTNLQLAWFDQMRASLDEDKPVWENVAGGKEFVTVGGGQKHVLGYMQEFLFTPDRARVPTRVLSGGERSRLLLAQLFSQPANLLVLDEPTNDLDLETLDLLEELLVDFAGTVLVVSHDRAFLDAVVTRTLALDGDGRATEAVGGYTDWLKAWPEKKPVGMGVARSSKVSTPLPAVVAVATAVAKAAVAPTPVPAAATARPPLGGREKRELAELPLRIEKLEAEQLTLGAALADLYAENQGRAVDTQRRLSAVDAELAAAYARWEELETLKS